LNTLYLLNISILKTSIIRTLILCFTLIGNHYLIVFFFFRTHVMITLVTGHSLKFVKNLKLVSFCSSYFHLFIEVYTDDVPFNQITCNNHDESRITVRQWKVRKYLYNKKKNYNPRRLRNFDIAR